MTIQTFIQASQNTVIDSEAATRGVLKILEPLFNKVAGLQFY